ncbi:hypothetical protein CXB51_003243 [Gossypium anomalum]|uniref:Uncharacterized protein n=1 Tax=Gossypium anomalum TaxID=47600 RepID=A0A8J6DDQ5_9ROSI|nr:hypothetical protein CXB51_003243 [Gossypium anomalum]
MATDAIPIIDTPSHSLNTGEAHQLLFILEGYGLEGFILGTVAIPPAFLAGSKGQLMDNPVFLTHKKQDKFLASWLLSTITDEVLAHLTAAKTSFDVWTAIERRFSTISTLKISSMRHALYSIKKSNLTITKYLSKVKTLCDNLIAVGSLVTKSQEPKHGHKEPGRGWSRGGGRSWSPLDLSVHSHGHFSSSPLCSSITHCCGSFSPTSFVSHLIPSRAPTPFTSDQLWYPNSGATNHITPEASNLTTAAPYTGTSHVTMGNGESIPIANVGSSTFLASSKLLRLQNVLHVSSVCKNLMSVGQFAKDNGVYFEFHPFLCFVKDIQTWTTLLESHLHEGLYQFQFSKTSSTKILPVQNFCSPLLNNAQISSSSLWHNRLGHPCNNTLARVLKSCNVSFRQNSLPHICTACQLGKAHKLLFGSSHTIYSSPFELVVTDVWGPTHVSSNGFSYYVSFVDMFSRYTWFWYYAFAHAVYFTNRLPTPVLSQVSPYETLYKLQPDYGLLCVFGCACFLDLRPFNQYKLQFRSQPCVFLGVAPNQKGYRFCSPSPIVPTRALHQQSVLLVVVPRVSSSPTVTRSARDSPEVPSCVQSLHSRPCSSSHSSANLSAVALAPTACAKSECPPATPPVTKPVIITEAFHSPIWTAAAQAKYNALIANHTWDLMPLPNGRREAGIDFQETFSPMVKPTTIRVVLALAVSLNWPLHQVDINKAFLNGDLSEEIYMVQPPGFEKQGPNGEHLICKLRKALYGLKQAPRAWFHKLKDFLVAASFEVSKADNSLFILRSGSQLLYVLVYDDDIIITGNDSRAIDRFVAQLNDTFSLKDLGKLSYFIGIEVNYGSNGVFLT